MAKRISTKNTNTEFTLKFNGSMGNSTYVETCTLVEVIDEDTDSARAVFTFEDDASRTWEAYRYNGHWAFGSSADRLSVVK